MNAASEAEDVQFLLRFDSLQPVNIIWYCYVNEADQNMKCNAKT